MRCRSCVFCSWDSWRQQCLRLMGLNTFSLVHVVKMKAFPLHRGSWRRPVKLSPCLPRKVVSLTSLSFVPGQCVRDGGGSYRFSHRKRRSPSVCYEPQRPLPPLSDDDDAPPPPVGLPPTLLVGRSFRHKPRRPSSARIAFFLIAVNSLNGVPLSLSDLNSPLLPSRPQRSRSLDGKMSSAPFRASCNGRFRL